MKWSYRLAQVAGIDIKIHATFALIVMLFALNGAALNGPIGAVFGALLILLLFACVTLHELGHALAAQRYGVSVREIVLLPLGGVALLGRMPRNPRQELIIALAGPLVNVIIAGLLFLVIGLSGNAMLLDSSSIFQGRIGSPSPGALLVWLFNANIMLVLFNMIPAFPLDGGRVLRAVLAMFLASRQATRIASLVGQTFAVFFGIIGLFYNLFLTVIAVFIYFGARQEYAEEQASTVLGTQRVGDAYNKYVLTLSIGDRVSKVLDYVLTSYQPDFAVLQNGRLLGIITRDDVLRAMEHGPANVYIPDVYVTTMMRREVLKVDADASLHDVRQMLSEHQERVAAVYTGGLYLGLINQDDIAEAFTVLSFVERYNNNNPRPDSDSLSQGVSTG